MVPRLTLGKRGTSCLNKICSIFCLYFLHWSLKRYLTQYFTRSMKNPSKSTDSITCSWSKYSHSVTNVFMKLTKVPFSKPIIHIYPYICIFSSLLTKGKSRSNKEVTVEFVSLISTDHWGNWLLAHIRLSVRLPPDPLYSWILPMNIYLHLFIDFLWYNSI